MEKLKLPPKPSSIAESDMRWRTATIELQKAQDAHRHADERYTAQVPGAPLTITRMAVDELGTKIEAFITAERVAAHAREQARVEYQREVDAALADPIADLHAQIAEKIGEIEQLLGLGARLNSEATAAGVTLPARLPHASPVLLQHLGQFRAWFGKIPARGR